MDKTDYLELFEDILEKRISEKPYNEESYMTYVKLNYARINRWLKTINYNEDITKSINSLTEPLTWILIAEPWCADAANVIPVLFKLAELSPMIKLDVQLRDKPPFLINQYLTNGGKAIPILIVRDEKGKDLFTWGPRPMECQELAWKIKKIRMDPTEKKATIQKWYNQDKGKSIQTEIATLINENCYDKLSA